MSCPLGELLHHGFLVAGGLGLLHMVLHLRSREVELVGGLDVRHLPEYRHELRQVEELREAGPCPVAGALGSQLNGRHRLPKGGGPVVKVVEPLALQRSLLEIPLHGIELRHGVGDRGAGGEHHALASGDLIQVAAFQEHITGFLGVAGGQARHIAHLCVCTWIFPLRLCPSGWVHTRAWWPGKCSLQNCSPNACARSTVKPLSGPSRGSKLMI